eukprot:GHVT01097522.1.p2 GENE.GHVT01097522.1~~GHVT01097522.1.p2  ORF type:complete len:505 (+),score=140.43 GHVT01097522.1:1212-2726(+)
MYSARGANLLRTSSPPSPPLHALRPPLPSCKLPAKPQSNHNAHAALPKWLAAVLPAPSGTAQQSLMLPRENSVPPAMRYPGTITSSPPPARWNAGVLPMPSPPASPPPSMPLGASASNLFAQLAAMAASAALPSRPRSDAPPSPMPPSPLPPPLVFSCGAPQATGIRSTCPSTASSSLPPSTASTPSLAPPPLPIHLQLPSPLHRPLPPPRRPSFFSSPGASPKAAHLPSDALPPSASTAPSPPFVRARRPSLMSLPPGVAPPAGASQSGCLRDGSAIAMQPSNFSFKVMPLQQLPTSSGTFSAATAAAAPASCSASAAAAACALSPRPPMTSPPPSSPLFSPVSMPLQGPPVGQCNITAALLQSVLAAAAAGNHINLDSTTTNTSLDATTTNTSFSDPPSAAAAGYLDMQRQQQLMLIQQQHLMLIHQQHQRLQGLMQPSRFAEVSLDDLPQQPQTHSRILVDAKRTTQPTNFNVKRVAPLQQNALAASPKLQTNTMMYPADQ